MSKEPRTCTGCLQPLPKTGVHLYPTDCLDALKRTVKKYERIMKKTKPPLCDHCLSVIAGEDRRIEMDGVRSTTMRITLCEPCYHRLLQTMRLGS